MTLYIEVILEHFRHPRNRGSLDAPDLWHEGVHPLCGDRIRMEASVEDGAVADARFRGDACAIATAAASILTEMIRGAPLEAVETLPDEQLLAALRADIPPARRGCALLPLEVLRVGIRDWRARQPDVQPGVGG